MRNNLPRNVKSNATRRRIMEVAYQHLESRDLDTLTLDALCEQAGVTKGAFYYHFDSKDQIIGNLYGTAIEKYLTEHGIQKPSGRFTNRAALKDWMLRYIRAHQQFDLYWGGEVVIQFLTTQFREHMLRAVDRGWLSDFVQIAIWAQEDGLIRGDLTPRQLASALQGWITGGANTFAFDSELYDCDIPDRVISDFLDIFILQE